MIATSSKSIIDSLMRRLILWVSTYAAEWQQPAPFDWKATLTVVIGTIVLLPLTTQLPMLGYEWPFYISGQVDINYPPYLQLAIKPFSIWPWRLGVAILCGLLPMTVAMSTFREASRISSNRLFRFGSSTLALLTPLIPMLMWEGNASIITMFGLLSLPYGVLFAVIQPHLPVWAMLARRRWTLFGIGFGILSLFIWGLWPIHTVTNMGNWIGHPSALGWSSMGWPVAVVGLFMLPFVNANPLRLMAVGAFLIPYALPVHFVLMLPAIGRVRGWRQVLLWASVWLLLLPYAYQTLWSKYIAMLFPLLVWWFLRNQPTADADDSPAARKSLLKFHP